MYIMAEKYQEILENHNLFISLSGFHEFVLITFTFERSTLLSCKHLIVLFHLF